MSNVRDVRLNGTPRTEEWVGQGWGRPGHHSQLIYLHKVKCLINNKTAFARKSRVAMGGQKVPTGTKITKPTFTRSVHPVSYNAVFTRKWRHVMGNKKNPRVLDYASIASLQNLLYYIWLCAEDSTGRNVCLVSWNNDPQRVKNYYLRVGLTPGDASTQCY